MECSVCKTPTNMRCSRCQSSYYCSRSCQKKEYANHKVVCPPRSADILVKNAIDDKMPTNVTVLYEYGFSNCLHRQDRVMLLGLYIGLIKLIGCSASQLHSWWLNGELASNIKKAYENNGYTSEYYKWFLKNEHLLQGLRKFRGNFDESLKDKYFETIKPYVSEHDQNVSIKSLPESKRKVFALYTTILIGYIPRIEEQNWIDFGFCTCKTEAEELKLGELFRELIIQRECKVDEFYDAYLSGLLIDLLKTKCNNSEWLSKSKIEIFRSSEGIKSVYYLKQYALDDSVDLQRSVNLDYGFRNCHTDDEKKQLKLMYKKLIKTPQFDPQVLHKACIAGKIFNYVKSILPNEVLKADLMENVYHLKDV